MAKDMRVAVVGGGIGGVTAAILLQRSGIACTIYEQAPAFARVGAGINVAPNSTRIFDRMGLGAAMRAVGVQPKLKFSRQWDSGEVLFTVPAAELAAHYGAPFFAFHRGDLQSVLTSALKPGSVELGKRLVGLETEAAATRLRFADGSAAVADVVIGADGVHSRVREALYGIDPPIYHGLSAHRAIYPTARLNGLKIADNTKWWGPDRYFLVYFISEARDEIYIITGVPQVWEGESLTPTAGSIEQVRAAFAGWHPEVQALIDACPEVSLWPMLERMPRRPWSQGSVVLLGDACHAMTPHMGQGAGMAIEDAAVLVRCLDATNDPASAFALYEANRFERTARVQHESHENQWTKTGMDHGWLYGYDALAVPLVPPAAKTAAAE